MLRAENLKEQKAWTSDSSGSERKVLPWVSLCAEPQSETHTFPNCPADIKSLSVGMSEQIGTNCQIPFWSRQWGRAKKRTGWVLLLSARTEQAEILELSIIS